MGSIRNFLKRILPPPVRTFLREIEGLRQLTEKQTRLLEQAQRETLTAVERLTAEQRTQEENLTKLLAAQTEELRRENSAYEAIPIRRVDEYAEPEFADSLDYYYVPTFYVEGKKLMEGVPSREKVKAVLDAALG